MKPQPSWEWRPLHRSWAWALHMLLPVVLHHLPEPRVVVDDRDLLPVLQVLAKSGTVTVFVPVLEVHVEALDWRAVARSCFNLVNPSHLSYVKSVENTLHAGFGDVGEGTRNANADVVKRHVCEILYWNDFISIFFM